MLPAATGESGTESDNGKAQAVLAAAKRMFLERGFAAVSMDAIAREAGVSKATVYAHFAGKEELFAAMIESEIRRRFADFTIGALDPRDPEAAFLYLGRRFLDLVLSPQAIAIHRIIVAEVSRVPDLGAVFWRAGPERIHGEITRFIEAAVAGETLAAPQPRLAAEQFLALLKGETQMRFLLRLTVENAEAVVEAAVRNATDLILRAYAPQAGAP